MIYTVHAPEACFPDSVFKADSLETLAKRLQGESAIIASQNLVNEVLGPDLMIFSYEVRVAYIEDFKIETADFVIHCID